MKKKVIAVLLMLTLAMTACGTNATTETPETEDATEVTEEAVVELENTMEDALETTEEVAGGGNIVIAVTADPQNVNPLYVTDQTSFDMQQAMYSPFFELVGGEYYYGNGLAQSIEANEDNSVYTMTLKEGLKWHDGEAITADDVVFTMDVLLDAEQNVPYASYGVINGEPVVTEKVDDLTVTFTLASSSAGFLGGLTQIYCIPEHVYAGVESIGTSELNNTPIGSGPFKYEEYKSGEYYKVAKFDDWFDTVSLDSITFKIVKDANSANAALASGDLDARLISSEEYETVSAIENITIYSYNSGRVNAMFFNNNNEAMADLNVRMAIAYALDKDELVNFAFISPEFAQTAYSILTPDTLFYNGELEQYNNDQAKAAEYLAASGQTNLTLDLAYISTNKAMESQAIYIQSKLAEIGITIELIPMDETTFKNKMNEKDASDFDLALSFYTLGEEPSLYADMSSTGSRSNYSRISDAHLDELWVQGNSVTGDARADVYGEIQSIVNDNMYIYPISYSNGFYAVNNEFGGFDKCILKTIYYDYSKIYLNK